MSRKHFVLLAQAIRESIKDKVLRDEVARALTPALRLSNPRFDPYRFISAAVGD